MEVFNETKERRRWQVAWCEREGKKGRKVGDGGHCGGGRWGVWDGGCWIKHRECLVQTPIWLGIIFFLFFVFVLDE